MAQQPPEKKLKPSASAINKTQLLLQDYTTVRQTVRDILGLVQKYGPLTSGQIEYNLPQVPSSIWGVPDILNILSSMEILHITKDTNAYCWNGGIPRADTVLPTDVMSKITSAIQEAEAAWQRSEILKEAVLKKMNHKDVLKKLLNEYPEIVNDPVYLAALKSSNIDLRGRVKRPPDSKPAAKPVEESETAPVYKIPAFPTTAISMNAQPTILTTQPAAVGPPIIPQPIKNATHKTPGVGQPPPKPPV